MLDRLFNEADPRLCVCLIKMKAASIPIVSDNPVVKKSFFDKLGEEDIEKREKCYDLLLDALVDLVAKAR